MSRTERGSATVELALTLPFLAVFCVLMVQVGAVLLDQLAVTQAAREAARAAAVDPSRGAAAAAAQRATSLDPAGLSVHTGPRPGRDGMVEVVVRYRSRVVMPVTGHVLLRPEVEARAAMRVEVGRPARP